ncbi:MAG: glycosyltransferase family 9 protein [bacterium]
MLKILHNITARLNKSKRIESLCVWSQEDPGGMAKTAWFLHRFFAIRRMVPGRKGFLLIFTGAIGDLISLTPAIRALKRRHPKSPIGLIVKGSATGCVLEYCPYLSQIAEFHVYENTRFKWWELIKTLHRIIWRRRYSTAILTMGTGWVPQHRIWGLLLLYASGAKRRIAFSDEITGWKPVPPGKNTGWKPMLLFKSSQHVAGWKPVLHKHLGLTRQSSTSILLVNQIPLANEIMEASRIQRTERFMELFEKAGLIPEGEERSTKFWNGEKDFREAAKFLECFAYREDGRPVVFVFPGVGSGPGKRWPEGRYIKVVNYLIEQHNARVFLDGMERDTDLCKTIALFAGDSCMNLAGQHSVGALCVLIQVADLVIASDSGPIHIAGAAQTPAVAIFGPTDPKVWAPTDPCITVLRKSDCPPCNNSFFCKERSDFACTEEVQVEDVIEACERILRDVEVCGAVAAGY